MCGYVNSCFHLGKSYNYKHKQTEIISVTGAADTNFVSDLSVWSGSFSRASFNLQEAYADLKKDEGIVMNYLQSKGLSKTEMTTSSISTEKLFDYTYDESGRQTGSVFKGYKLSESVNIESKDLVKIDKISREITELIQQGVELTSSSPNYYYTKLGDLKIGLLAKASEDGSKRAETIAKMPTPKLVVYEKQRWAFFKLRDKTKTKTTHLVAHSTPRISTKQLPSL